METSEKTACISILTNALLVLIKFALALVSGSLAIIADTVHSLTDVVLSAVILIGIKISKRRTRTFPYGLYKLENLVALGTSMLIFLAAYEIVKEVFSAPSPLVSELLPLAVSGISLTIVITWFFSRYELKKGEETGSPSLVADVRHVYTDMLSSLVILASLLASAGRGQDDHGGEYSPGAKATSEAGGAFGCRCLWAERAVMFGLNESPGREENMIVPIRKFDLKIMSLGMIAKDGQAFIWRGPVVGKAIQQLLGTVPIELDIRVSGDAGIPLVVSDPDSDAGQIFQAIAKNILATTIKIESQQRL